MTEKDDYLDTDVGRLRFPPSVKPVKVNGCLIGTAGETVELVFFDTADKTVRARVFMEFGAFDQIAEMVRTNREWIMDKQRDKHSTDTTPNTSDSG